VELPGWISLDMAKALLVMLRGKLYDELHRLSPEGDSKHHRNFSVQSLGSVASDDSNLDDAGIRKWQRS
jgi:hypothetical protein